MTHFILKRRACAIALSFGFSLVCGIAQAASDTGVRQAAGQEASRLYAKKAQSAQSATTQKTPVQKGAKQSTPAQTALAPSAENASKPARVAHARRQQISVTVRAPSVPPADKPSQLSGKAAIKEKEAEAKEATIDSFKRQGVLMQKVSREELESFAKIGTDMAFYTMAKIKSEEAGYKEGLSPIGLSYMNLAASFGDPFVMCMVGTIFADIAKKNNDKTMIPLAEYWLQRAVAAGEISALFPLGDVMIEYATPEAIARMVAVWEWAAREGNKLAAFHLISIYEDGIPTIKQDPLKFAYFNALYDDDGKNAEILGKIIEKRDNRDVAQRLALLDADEAKDGFAWNGYMTQEDISSAVVAAKQKNPSAMMVVGRASYEGVYMPVDYAYATKLLDEAAELGNLEAQFFQARRYLLGFHSEKNWPKAVRFLQMAAERGDPSALALLGHIYKIGGEGIPRSQLVSTTYYRKAAEFGNPTARFFMGLNMLLGSNEFIPKDVQKGLAYLTWAANREDPDAQKTLAVYYSGRIDGKIDEKKAIYWANRFADKGNEGLYHVIGDYYFQNNHVAAAAAYYFSAATEMPEPNVFSQYLLGMIYRNSDMVVPNEESSVYWFEQVAAQGGEDGAAAQKKLDEWKDHPEGIQDLNGPIADFFTLKGINEAAKNNVAK